MTHIATLEPEDGRIIVLFPDLPGCGTVGDTLDEALVLAAEALGGHVESLREIGGAIPVPRSLPSIRAEVDDLEKHVFECSLVLSDFKGNGFIARLGNRAKTNRQSTPSDPRTVQIL